MNQYWAHMSSSKVFKCLHIQFNRVEHLPIEKINHCYIVNTEGATKKDRQQIEANMMRNVKGYATEQLCNLSTGDLMYFSKYCDAQPTSYTIKYTNGKLLYERMVGKPILLDPDF